MSREPLMLNDTVMVLLRHWDEMQDYLKAFYAEIQHVSLGSDEYHARWREWDNTHDYYVQSGLIKIQFLHEIWLLWTFPDLPVVRHFDWHLVFNDRLMMMAETTFFPLEDYPRYLRSRRSVITREIIDTRWFLYELDSVYKQAVSEQTKTKTTL